jgi:hypothetical protein
MVRGRSGYSRSCAQCHDGPFAGSLSETLGRFPETLAMLGYMRDTTPQDRPGSLEFDHYSGVLAMVLVDEKLVPEDAALDPNALSDVKL